MGTGRRCKNAKCDCGRGSSRILLYWMLSKRIWTQHFWFFGQHCNEWQNESQSRLRSNLVSAGNLRHINIIVIQTGKLIFVRSEIAPPLNFAALFGRTPRTCLGPALSMDLFSLGAQSTSCKLSIVQTSTKQQWQCRQPPPPNNTVYCISSNFVVVYRATKLSDWTLLRVWHWPKCLGLFTGTLVFS